MSSYPEPDLYAGMAGLSPYGGAGLSPYGSLSPFLNIDPSQYLSEDGGAQFVFPEDATKKRGWGERMFGNIGTGYMIGIGAGGIYGLYEGVKLTRAASDTYTLKKTVNGALNAMTRRGPFIANSLGVVALMYGCTNAAVEKASGLEDSPYTRVASGAITGALFRCTAGARAIGIGTTLGVGITAGYTMLGSFMNNRGGSISSSWKD